jgi:hypothetical protein
LLQKFAGLQANVRVLDRHIISERRDSANNRLSRGQRAQAAIQLNRLYKLKAVHERELDLLRTQRDNVRQYELSRAGDLCSCAAPVPVEQPSAVDVSVG